MRICFVGFLKLCLKSFPGGDLSATGSANTKKTGFQPALKKEEVGFEPTVRYKRTTVFKTAPINRSGTLPNIDWVRLY